MKYKPKQFISFTKTTDYRPCEHIQMYCTAERARQRATLKPVSNHSSTSPGLDVKEREIKDFIRSR